VVEFDGQRLDTRLKVVVRDPFETARVSAPRLDAQDPDSSTTVDRSRCARVNPERNHAVDVN